MMWLLSSLLGLVAYYQWAIGDDDHEQMLSFTMSTQPMWLASHGSL